MGLTLRRWIIFLLIAGICATPFLMALKSAVGQQMLEKMFAQEASVSLVTSDWGWFVSQGLPLLLLVLTFVIFRADKHELFHRFGPIFLVLAVDLFVGALPFLSGGSIDSELYFHRISNLFCRYLYFLPFFHFISIQRPMRRIPHGETWVRFREKTASLLHNVLHRPRIAWTGAGIGAICVFVWGNAFAIQGSHEENVVAPMIEVQKQLDLTAELSLKENGIVVYEDLIPNLLTSSVTSQVSLLPSASSNQLDEQRILERILLHAKIFKWEEDRLAAFFKPNRAFAGYDSFKGRQLVTRELIEPGLGNWLLNYKKKMTPISHAEQLAFILEKYRALRLDELLLKHPVSAVIAKNSTPPLAGFSPKAKRSGYTLLTPTPAPRP